MAYMENAKFEDIQKGDRVRVENTIRDLKTTNEGVAFELSTGYSYWKTAGGVLLTMVFPGVKITILERPEPVLEDSALLIDCEGDVWQYDCYEEKWSCAIPGEGPLTYTNLVGMFGPVKHIDKYGDEDMLYPMKFDEVEETK